MVIVLSEFKGHHHSKPQLVVLLLSWLVVQQPVVVFDQVGVCLSENPKPRWPRSG
jgi:hypothetical protein